MKATFGATLFVLCCCGYGEGVNSNSASIKKFIGIDSATSCTDYYGYCSRPNGGLQGTATTAPQKMKTSVFARSRCYCDDQCRHYGDCCPDKAASVNAINAVNKPNEEMDSPVWECQNIPFQVKFYRYFYVLASCPPKYQNAAIAKRCSRTVPDADYDYTLDLPVLSTATNITYANVYCAICNGDTQLRVWKLLLLCSPDFPACNASVLDWQYVPRARQWRLDPTRPPNDHRTDAFFEVEEEFINVYTKYGARKCRQGVIRSCPDNWSGKRERHLCRSYSLLVKSIADGRVYQNEHCATCHGQSLSQLSCVTLNITEPKDYWNYSSAFVNSYSIVMNFFTATKDECDGGTTCGYRMTCDARAAACQLHACEKPPSVHSGDCVAVPSPEGATNRSTHQLSALEVDCQQTAPQDEHSWFDPKKYYQRHNGTSVWWCRSVAPPSSSDAQGYFTTACLLLSILCLAVYLGVNLALLPQLRSVPSLNLLSFATSLIVAQASFLLGLKAREPHALCVAMGLTIQYGFLASFFWTNVMAFDVFRTFATRFARPKMLDGGRTFVWYSVYAWAVPLFLVVATGVVEDWREVGVQYRPLYGQPLCFINQPKALLVFFTLPQGALLLFNIALYIVTIVKIYCDTREARQARQSACPGPSGRLSKNKTQFWIYVKLGLIMGLTWIFGFLARAVDSEPLWYLYILFNALQGAFLLVAFTCKPKILHMLRAKVPWRRRNNPKSSTSGSSTKISSLHFHQTVITLLSNSKDTCTSH